MSDWVKNWVKTQDSLLWTMPPQYYKLWQFLLYNCKNGKYKGSLSDIAKGIQWTEQGKKRPTRSTVQTMINWMSDQKMIESDVNGRNRTLYIKNWDKYQGGKGKGPKMQGKAKSEGEDPTITSLVTYYQGKIDSNTSITQMTRKYVNSKVRKWGKETVMAGMDEFRRRCDANKSFEDRVRWKGIDYWFRYSVDEMVNLSKRRKEEQYDGIPRVSTRRQKPTAQQGSGEGDTRELSTVR